MITTIIITIVNTTQVDINVYNNAKFIEISTTEFPRKRVLHEMHNLSQSLCSIVDLHSDKRRGVDVTVVGEESMIHWNGPLVNKANGL